MDFTKMSLSEIQKELDRFRSQLENQNFPISDAQKRRYKALQKAYRTVSEWACK